jgi:hypothetical protein
MVFTQQLTGIIPLWTTETASAHALAYRLSFLKYFAYSGHHAQYHERRGRQRTTLSNTIAAHQSPFANLVNRGTLVLEAYLFHMCTHNQL